MSFLSRLSEIVNDGQSRSIILTGNVSDLFFYDGKYVPLVYLLKNKYNLSGDSKSKGITVIVYEINDNIKVVNPKNMFELEVSWEKYMKPKDKNGFKNLETLFGESKGNVCFSLELLRQLTVCTNLFPISNDLLIIIEGGDFILPEMEVNRMSLADRQRVAIVHDWFSEPNFMNGHNSVIIISESRSLLHHKVSKLPQIIEIPINLPNVEQRQQFIDFWPNKPKQMPDKTAILTAGLSLHALRQLLCQERLELSSIVEKVEDYLQSQMGEESIEFLRPTDKFDKVRGSTDLKPYLADFGNRFLNGGEYSPIGAAFAGPIGGGKTYIGQALAAEIGVPVLVLSGLRSMWFGETDLIFERLQRAILALNKVIVFVDEADTQLGSLSEESHSTEKRLLGKMQAMMSDSRFKGSVLWILMTARIHLLSPDVRRPGRAGDLIIPILDPEGDDLDDFLEWVLDSLPQDEKHKCKPLIKSVCNSPASLGTIRSEIRYKNCNTAKEVMAIVDDILLADIELTREYQKLQAIINCTRKSLLPKSYQNKDCLLTVRKRIQELELLGVR